jgi:putative flippase GtrA
VASIGGYLGLLSLFVHVFAIPALAANAIAYACATLLNYLLNFYWSFRSTQPHLNALSRFLTVVAVGFVLNSVYVGAVTHVTGWPVSWVGLSFALAWPAASFLALKFWALR